MSKEIFISYSRRDQEFVTRLAADLNEQVAGVWFDQSAIQAGQKWHDEIMAGIRNCQAFILVLSPDAIRSRHVREELNTALEYHKTIFPVIYRSARWKDEFADVVRDIQSIYLQSGSYTSNFHKLVDGLVEAGAGKTTTYERPFLRGTVQIGLKEVLRKAFGWAFAWSLGWLAFCSVTFIFFFFLIAALVNRAGWEDLINFGATGVGALSGGFAGGWMAGLLSMLVLRPYVPSISWKHMSPTIRIWLVSGPLGVLITSAAVGMMLITGLIALQDELPACDSTDFGECTNQLANRWLDQDIGVVLPIVLTYLIFLLLIWFLTGLFAGWLVVRHIRRLEPGITTRQAWRVSLSWGVGAIIAAMTLVLVVSAIASRMGTLVNTQPNPIFLAVL